MNFESGAREDGWGRHRVIAPAGVLPQAAQKLDADMTRVFESELLIDVEILNIDSASFTQMADTAKAAGEEIAAGVAERIRETVLARGKQHNPVTGSGGMLLGRVARIGRNIADSIGLGRDLAVGDRVATLVSLTLTPLSLEEISEVRVRSHQVVCKGQALLFASGQLAKLPSDIPETVALAALDVAGAAPQVERLAKPGGAILILGGGGKSGLLCATAARKAVGAIGYVAAVEGHPTYAEDLRRLGVVDEVFVADARDVSAVTDHFAAPHPIGAVGGFDLVVSSVNVPDVEMTAILSAKQGGTVYFFSMATSFTKAALGAEGVSRDVMMVVGNGYCPGHAERTLEIVRGNGELRRVFEERYGG